MIIVDKTNLDSAITKNVKEVLDTNSLSVSVKSSYSQKSSIPVMVVESDTRQVSKPLTRSSTPIFIATVTIHNIEKYYGKSFDQRSVVRNLIYDNEEYFSRYNMTLHDVADNYSPIPRGEGRIHNAILTVQFIIN